jgi:hypothetical protein
MQSDRERELQARERAVGRVTSGRRHPVAPERALVEPSDPVRLPPALSSRPAVG